MARLLASKPDAQLLGMARKKGRERHSPIRLGPTGSGDFAAISPKTLSLSPKMPFRVNGSPAASLERKHIYRAMNWLKSKVMEE
jgi:hypothetical protein